MTARLIELVEALQADQKNTNIAVNALISREHGPGSLINLPKLPVNRLLSGRPSDSGGFPSTPGPLTRAISEALQPDRAIFEAVHENLRATLNPTISDVLEEVQSGLKDKISTVAGSV